MSDTASTEREASRRPCISTAVSGSLWGMSTSQSAVLPSPSPRAVLAALGTLAVAAITLLTVFKLVDWSAAQTALVVAEVGAVTGLVTALVAHLTPATSKEHVALAATFTATVAASLALGSGFGWWDLTEQETSAVGGVITAVLGVGGAVVARHRVTAEISPE
jgi:hypothetical protein